MIDVHDVVSAISWVQPPWVDGGESYREAEAVADAYRKQIDAGDAIQSHDAHALWMLEAALEWAARDDGEGEPVAYKPVEECPYCAAERTEGGVSR